MSELYNNIVRLCESVGIKPGKMCDDIGISRSMISDLSHGRKKTFSAEILQKIAKYFGVSVEFLIGENKNSPENRTVEMLQSLRDSERFALSVLRNMNDDDIYATFKMIKQLKGEDNNVD